MTGLLFHGPEVFDSGWAARLLRVFPGARCMLAGTMSRTALFDSGLKGVETPGTMPSECVKALAAACSSVLIATKGKNPGAGLVFGRLVAGRAAAGVPVVQAECSGPVYAAMAGACPRGISRALDKLGFSRACAPDAKIELWNEGGLLCRRMTTADKGDFVLVNGIVTGRALGGEIVLACKGRCLKEIRGVRVKPHGLEKLERLGGVDLALAKLASAPRLRRSRVSARKVKCAGRDVVFIDHAGMHVYALAGLAAGAVTVGDDTTAVAGDILRRFGVPVIGIVDGDGDGLHKGGFARGSVVLTVKADDKAGLEVLAKVFRGKKSSQALFNEIKHDVRCLLAGRVIACAEY
ncbi:MAG TPA: DUF2117 domain-containing protein [Elusimicrobiales bacterium]|nr:DUF2117 domain-containing protein [Elusimicrobiales bacterium]